MIDKLIVYFTRLAFQFKMAVFFLNPLAKVKTICYLALAFSWRSRLPALSKPEFYSIDSIAFLCKTKVASLIDSRTVDSYNKTKRLQMDFLASLSNEVYWALLLITNFLCVLLAYRFFGKTGLYIWVPIATILANIQVLKMVDLVTIGVTLGNITYASSFLVTDILSENYGKKAAQKAVMIGFFSLLATVVIMNIALLFKPNEFDFIQESLANIFSILPRIAFASLVAYGISQLHDIWAYNFWKKKFPTTKWLWLRNNASTMVSQLLDTLIFTFIAFWGLLETSEFMQILISTYVLKWIVASIDTPFLYIAKSMFTKGKIPVETVEESN